MLHIWSLSWTKRIQDSSNLDYFSISCLKIAFCFSKCPPKYQNLSLYIEWFEKRNRNGNVLTNMVYDHSNIATLWKPKTWSDYSEKREGVEVDSRTSSQIGQGSRGWSPLFLFSFSRPNTWLDIVASCGRPGNMFLNKPSVWKHT